MPTTTKRRRPSRRSSHVTVKDLALAYLEANTRGRGITDRDAYYRSKLGVLERLFDFKLADDERLRRLWLKRAASGAQDWEPESYGEIHDLTLVIDTAEAAINLWREVRSPFVVHVGGGPGPLETALRRPLERSVTQRVAAARDAYRRVVEAALLLLDPTLKTKRFDRRELVERGVPEEMPPAEWPDSDD